MSRSDRLRHGKRKLGDRQGQFIEARARGVKVIDVAKRFGLQFPEAIALDIHFQAHIRAWPNEPAPLPVIPIVSRSATAPIDRSLPAGDRE